MYSVNNESQETNDKFCVMGSRLDQQGWIKLIQSREQLANQNIRTNNKSKAGGTTKVKDKKEAIVLRKRPETIISMHAAFSFNSLWTSEGFIAQKGPKALLPPELQEICLGNLGRDTSFPAQMDTYGQTSIFLSVRTNNLKIGKTTIRFKIELKTSPLFTSGPTHVPERERVSSITGKWASQSKSLLLKTLQHFISLLYVHWETFDWRLHC